MTTPKLLVELPSLFCPECGLPQIVKHDHAKGKVIVMEDHQIKCLRYPDKERKHEFPAEEFAFRKLLQ